MGIMCSIDTTFPVLQQKDKVSSWFGDKREIRWKGPWKEICPKLLSVDFKTGSLSSNSQLPFRFQESFVSFVQDAPHRASLEKTRKGPP